MPDDVHFEPFVHLAGLTHERALVAWGGFFFHPPGGEGRDWRIVEDPELGDVAADAREGRGSIGVSSPSYGDAEVEVREVATGEVVARAEANGVNHACVGGLEPDTDYRYTVSVDGAPWAAGVLRDWAGDGLVEMGRRYDRRFRTFPPPEVAAPLRFAVIGDYGIGILASGGHGERQGRIARALERAVERLGVRLVVTTGDNIYLGEEDTVAGTGNHDDDWYFSFYQPYRYVIDKVPFYPVVGNHDASETETADDRDQLADNFFTDLRFAEDVAAGRASVDPGLYYSFSYGADVDFVAVDTTAASSLEQRYFFDHPRHRRFLENAFPPREAEQPHPRWRIPFSHHPPFCAGPRHHNHPALVSRVVPLFERAGVAAMFSGHEHNFQHAEVGGVTYFVSGAAGKLRPEPPDALDEAGVRSWASEGHFLVVDVDGERMKVHPVVDIDDDGTMRYLRRNRRDGGTDAGPIVVAPPS